MMDSSLLVGVITGATAIAGIFIGGTLTKKRTIAETGKLNAETESVRTANFKSTIDIYNIVHKELSDELKKVIARCIELTGEMSIFREENLVLKNEVKELRKENVLLTNEIHILNSKFKDS